jgi:pyruvate/2-oxoglutarate dehydrogenase complex dihydrolipoamide acyltransferase (E2) component
MDCGLGINYAVHGNCAGAIGAEFLKAFKGYIENPTSMLL